LTKQCQSGPLAEQRQDHGRNDLGPQVRILPRYFLWIRRIKVGKEVRDGQGQQAGRVVGHGVGRAGDVEISRVVPMVLLVHCLEAEEVGRGAGGGRGPATLPANSCNVVGARRNGTLADIIVVGRDVLLKDGRRELQVRIGDRTVGLSVVTRRDMIAAGNLARQTMGAPARRGVESAPCGSPLSLTCSRKSGLCEMGNQTPPMPRPQASPAPSNSGLDWGTNLYSRVGLEDRFFSSQRKSSRQSWTPRLRRMRLLAWWWRASCRRLKSPREPGMASNMDRSSPKTLCHFLTLVRF
jgi:hypothetical protein